MAKRWRKQKAGQQQKKRRKPAPGSGDASSAGGAIGGFRRFTKGLFGGGKSGQKKTGASRALDILFWVAIIIVAYFLAMRRCAQ